MKEALKTPIKDHGGYFGILEGGQDFRASGRRDIKTGKVPKEIQKKNAPTRVQRKVALPSGGSVLHSAE